jgi:hypothetical protein
VRREAYQVSISSTAGLSRQPFLLPGEHVDKSEKVFFCFFFFFGDFLLVLPSIGVLNRCRLYCSVLCLAVCK